jgi:GntR family transcriptional regulator, transcriptional repressor for pyruvate dehydrogenase complex
MEKVVLGSAARATADVLREEILRRESEDFLGSEDELIDRLGVSRPTLRQAARILEAEELLVVKRGWNGGFFARRPEASAVTRIAGLYLRSERTTFGDVWHTLALVGAEAARLAAANPDAEARRALVTMVREAEPDGSSGTAASQRFARLRVDFLRKVVALVPSPSLQLVVAILSETTRTNAAASWFMDKEQQEFTYEYLEKLARAIANGHGDAASRHYLRFAKEAAERFPMLMDDVVATR